MYVYLYVYVYACGCRVCVCVRVHVSVYERKTERGREGERDQATAIQLAGESSTLRKDIKPGYLWANPLICKQNAHKVSTESHYFNAVKGTWRICCLNGHDLPKDQLILLKGIKDNSKSNKDK